MQLQSIIEHYKPLLFEKYGSSLLTAQRQAIHAMQRCRTADSCALYVQCTQCEQSHWKHLSFGHRSCPVCQNHGSSRPSMVSTAFRLLSIKLSQWLDRQQKKLLPVEFFMVTFTLPCQLRTLVWRNQKTLYTIFFSCVASTLKDFGLTPQNMGRIWG